MKNLILTLVFLGSMIAGKSQTTFWINNTTASAGQISIPVYVTEFDSIATVSLGLQHSPNLSFDGFQNINSNIPFPMFFTAGNELIIGLFSLDCITIPDSAIIFELLFNFSGGMGTLIWDTAICAVGSCDINPIIPAFTNGYINTSVGINEIGHPITRCFPNPTTDIVNFTTVVENFRLYNTFGQLLFSDKDVQNVDLTSFGKGVYIAVLDNAITKIVKR